ncbi:MAG: NAD(P)-dependent oxidoreductase [Rhodospirillales bacterium]|nr:NAD(P)-dependent oxidoreductase [Rhodospirillales bacterium]
MTTTRIGFIGLGNMGRRMAPRLIQAGHRLTVFDIDAKAVADCVAGGKAVAAKSLRDLGSASDVVVSVLPHAAAVAQAFAGEPWGQGDHVAAGLGRGAVVIDMSAAAPAATQRLSAWLGGRGIALVDAPVSGMSGKQGAAEGTLNIMCGGAEAVIDRCMPILALLGKNIFKTGPVGSGHAVKAFQNYLAASQLIAALETLLACKRFGVDPTLALEIFNISPGYSSISHVTMPEHVMTRKFATGFSLGYLVKDVRAAMEIAKDMGVATPLGSPCLAYWEEVLARLGPNLCYTNIARVMEEQAGETLAGPTTTNNG